MSEDKNNNKNFIVGNTYKNKITQELYVLIKFFDDNSGTFCMIRDSYNYTIPFKDMIL